MPLRGLGYLGVTSPDLAPWRAFATELIGLAPAAASAGMLRFRMDVRSYRIAVHRAARAGLAYAGWEAADRDALDAVAARLRAAGVAVSTPSADERAERGVSALVRFSDPWGHPHEVFCGAFHDFDSEFVSPAGVSGFVTENGMGHLLLGVPDCNEAEDFYVRALGLRVTDRMAMGGGHRAVFLRASPRHHSLALTDVLPEPGLHHIMLETRTLEDVGRAWDRVQDQRVPIQMTLGQHANDPLVSFYVATPGGFGLELGWNGMLIDESRWAVREFGGRGEIWGHRGAAMEEITQARAKAAS
ncbi:MAG: 2,3-dihydroxybiphenyl 1,2-dioxygenase [Deltaproteobacteria bacterium]|nr:MAG: 2,3-dihydroxybiphenyl 1,2-dioxygenase [Deltaproteobacteria bacterium]